MKKNLFYEFTKGLWNESPTFRQLLGMCPTLAVTTSVINGFSMGMATSFVLICSSTIISFIRKLIPNQVRIASYIVIIAAFVTVADLFLKGNFPAVSKALGPFIPLIVVNCVILGRAEAFAAKNNPLLSFADALGMGLGFTLALTMLGTIREILGSGTIFGFLTFEPWVVMILPGGAFITLGLLIGLINFLKQKANKPEVHAACEVK
ncbi:electron transport complex subunit RsxE [candidate division WOR-1 bacterium RIFOXYB2_FULL_42_35]|uniref:Ion-translocating oxidoreductase complex subunit E n=1 Tax=candidate division WOR-1 bacterium RIFOXYC2_FULL_41_25 TaxID=1802586 RepID=A0A1F4TPG5_UNCSA|nr:MAG: electron transport complex subunit RsxE [candidate division WOR-1 bacterium RIFOXYB2_FULL_42_35]OGC24533.1 MAG: electron transport complex subunit RsxE [candidate division WOR-1 bacterium RIFOXYA2_FULL_41_14]OGC34578.1 MAG: electron transport complex subunit RsxE [candidate division WOR-1 bacterium RIFOXYC2_FULL_41_25]OGC43731.1 MAG: electron transport complex subunit RsxE [candidate division WOR-1 bacterium RIFOXYD2_FULL_41_8]